MILFSTFSLADIAAKKKCAVLRPAFKKKRPHKGVHLFWSREATTQRSLCQGAAPTPCKLLKKLDQNFFRGCSMKQNAPIKPFSFCFTGAFFVFFCAKGTFAPLKSFWKGLGENLFLKRFPRKTPVEQDKKALLRSFFGEKRRKKRTKKTATQKGTFVLEP